MALNLFGMMGAHSGERTESLTDMIFELEDLNLYSLLTTNYNINHRYYIYHRGIVQIKRIELTALTHDLLIKLL